MVRNLYLARHADAEDLQSGMRDQERSLTRTGYKNAAHAGRFLAEKDIRPDVFLSSTAVRARQTTETFADQLKYSTSRIIFTDEIYEASTRILLRIITLLPEDAATVIILGHNPGVTFLAEFLTGADIGNVAPAGIVHLQWADTEWKNVSQNSAQFVAYQPPEDPE